MLEYDSSKFLTFYTDIFAEQPNESKRKGLLFLLDHLAASRRIDTIPKHSYTLATVKWETANTFQPVTEYGSLHYLQSKPYYPYIGRGYVQLTWKENYRKFGNALGIDLINHPDLANVPEFSWQILELGMTDNFGVKDPDFTSYTLEDFFYINGEDYYKDYFNARKIINPKDYDSYAPIAIMASNFEKILQASVIIPEIDPI